MFMSVIASGSSVASSPELAGARVLITGLSSSAGVDLARTFAENGCRLVIQSQDECAEVAAIAEVLAKSALDVRLQHDPLNDGEAGVRFAQTGAQAFGGLDAVVNVLVVDHAEHAECASVADIEDFISRKLLPATLMTRVLANRMRLTLIDGMILNVVLMPEPANDRESALAGLMRAALAAMTRGEAAHWAGQGIRINAVGPRTGLEGDAAGASLTSEPDIAALAVHLASRRGRNLSGHVFDAAGIAKRRC